MELTKQSAIRNPQSAIKSHPELLNAHEVIFCLQRRIRLTNAQGATEYVQLKEEDYKERVTFGVSLCNLYKELFPRKYKYSMHADFSPAKEREFYTVVSTNCFPIDFQPYEEHGDGWLYAFIPVTSIQKHDWLNHRNSFDEYPLHAQLALALHAPIYQDECRELLATIHGITFEITPKKDIDTHRLHNLFKTETTPLRYLPIAVSLVNYTTGNVWLDAHPMLRIHLNYEWTKENVLELAHDYKEAMKIVRLIWEFSEWLIEEPKTRMLECINAWNSCRKESENIENE